MIIVDFRIGGQTSYSLEARQTDLHTAQSLRSKSLGFHTRGGEETALTSGDSLPDGAVMLGSLGGSRDTRKNRVFTAS
jgi:hypothetical protein